MPNRAYCHRTSRSQIAYRAILLAGVSMVTLMALNMPAQARNILGGGGGASAAVANAAASAMVSAQQASAAAQAAQNSLTRATQALQAMQAAQSAAHALALSAPSTTVPNGLTAGGLVPVANPNSTTDGLTDWIGANAPTQTTEASGHVDVTVQQTQSAAILSWQSFNVGSNTTLTFDQQGNASWVALNRVVGSVAPSQILGQIKADGTVLVINQNGIIFGGGAQINVNSLIASGLDIGRVVDTATETVRTIAQRDQEFLSDGLIGFAETDSNGATAYTFSPTSATKTGPTSFAYSSSGPVLVENGAQIASGDSGYILLTAPTVENAGHLAATDGQVILAAGDALTLGAATGAVDSAVPGIRGFLASPINLTGTAESTLNDATGLIESPQGSIFLGAANGVNDATVNAGGLFATTSVSRNGAIQVSGSDIELAPGSIIAITPDTDGETIPQDPTSLTDFEPSQIYIGGFNFGLSNQDTSALVDVEANTLIYAPSGNITIGAVPGATASTGTSATSRVFVDSGAVIDASGLENVTLPASANTITISPLTANDLADDPNYQGSFLDGATVTVDPRLSGVRSDGVAWVGSPLIDAASYYQQVGVSVEQLMTKGGNVSLGVDGYNGTGAATTSPNVVVKNGAVINVAGGWVTYQAGTVRTTELVDASGHIVNIGNADPNDTYIGIYNGFVVDHPHWGISETYASPLISGSYYEAEYTEGRDAGSLTVMGSAATLDGTVYAQAFPGERQLFDGQPGTGTSSVYGDERLVQAAPSQLPAGGFLFIDAQAQAQSGYTGGADIEVEAAASYQPLPSDLAYGQAIQVTPGTGDVSSTVTIPTRDPSSYLTPAQLGTIDLSDGLLSGSGFSQVSLHTSGSVMVAADANVTLNPGGVFDVLAGRKVSIEGTVSVPSGSISLATFDSRGISAGGSVFSTTPAQVGDFDIVVDGTLSAAGRWVNDYNLPDDQIEGPAWLDGGSVTLYGAPRISTITSVTSGATPATSTDLSGSILIDPGSLVDVSGGGRIDQQGNLDLSAKGGNLSLYDETSYFEIAGWSNLGGIAGSLSGFRVDGLSYQEISGGSEPYVPVNPDQVNAHVAIDPNSIRAQGFAGGGTFTLTTPEFAFSDDTNSDASPNATLLPLLFFSSAGFARYDITSYKTDLIANPFTNGLGGTDAILATQTLTIGAGQTLNLTQSMLPSILGTAQMNALLNLASGGDLFSVLTPSVPTDAWDRQAADLTLGGLLELDVAQGGSITGDAGAVLTVDKLYNQGTIQLPGGTIAQQEVLPVLYTEAGALGIHALADAFTVNPDGTIDETTISQIGGLTNAHLAGAGSPSATPNPIYLLGNLDADQGIVLALGSVTDLSGASIRDPYATGPLGQPIVTGRMVAGGTIETLPSAALNGQTIFQPALGSSYQLLAPVTETVNGINQTPLDVAQAGRQLVLDPGSMLDLSGASDTYQEPIANGSLIGASYVSTPVWSDAGMLSAGAGATLTGATILAQGGAPEAQGGTLVMLDPVLSQHDPSTPTANVVSADMIAGAGFDTLVALGSVSNAGDATITLGRGFFLETGPVVDNGASLNPDLLLPTLSSGGGTLTIDAPYVGLDSNFDTISLPAIDTAAADGSIVFNAQAIDFSGAIRVDPSVASATFNASGDIRFTGVVPWQQTYYPGTAPVATLNGLIASSGDLTFNAGQLYPTTGTSFAITSAAANGTITFGRSGTAVPTAPYSAGGNLTIQAANIVQGGVIRVPLGTLTLGGDTASAFALATQTLTLAAGGITSVSADGLVIPYGTTTDQTEWYFAPTDTDALTTPSQKLLSLGGSNITIAVGATVDLTGGGDIYAYEFVPGTGGSRDVLDQLNPDTYTSNNGYQYPDGRQVYAIVPGLSSNPTAAYDPIYSANYAALGTSSQAGMRVYLNAAPGLAAGWYTLLPAQYAMLPGGMRVVEQNASGAIGAGGTLLDGTIVTTGTYGDAFSGASQSQLRLFEVQSQAVIEKESDIAITTGNTYFANLAAHNGTAVPQLPIDAGRLVINPGATLEVDAILSTAAALGGRGAEVDIAAPNIDILASLAGAPADGAVHLTATSLANLNTDSLLIGGTRTDNSDGTTAIDVTTQNLLVQNDASDPLSAAEILLAATGDLAVADGSVIAATGTLSNTSTGAYDIGSDTTSGTGVLLRVANGPERLVDRTNSTNTASLTVGAATLSGTAVMFDSSGADSLDRGLVIQNAKYVALGAPRIGFGADPATYNGLVVTGELQNLLTQSGAQLTLRSQSSIDFTGGSYSFGDIRFDAAALSDLDGGNVTINADTVSLGNAGAAGTVCTTCGAGNGTLAIDANQILFTGGAIATKASTLTTSTPATLAADVTITVSTGTMVGGQPLTAPAEMVIPAGTAITLGSGTGLVLPAGADGSLASGSTVTPATIAAMLPAGGSYFFPNGYEYLNGGTTTLSASAGTYSLTDAVAPNLPSGTQAVLGASASAALTQFFGGGVTLSASNGIFAQGIGSVLDVGPATLAIHTPYIGDRATVLAAGVDAVIPDLTLASTGAVTIDNAGAAALGSIVGIPGSAVTIDGQSVSISGTDIRATAGKVQITSSTGITLTDGATIEAPGYTAVFGDSADPVDQDAPGGSVTLAAQSGNVALGNATLSVGGGSGDAGTLTLSAPDGAVDFGTATLNGTGGPGGAGGSFALETNGAVDLVALNTSVGADGFTGGFSIDTSIGDLILAAGQTLKSGAVSLTADGGLVDIAGTIDTSGVNGGDVSLYGRTGVTLEGSARIEAYATGYAATDTRQAKGGDVTLGTDFTTSTTNADGSVTGTSGALAIANGAVIDVAAQRPGDRLVPYYANGTEYYNYVQGDQGGTVTLRAPVVAPSGADTVNVSVASANSIVGASAIDLVGFKRWDLGAVANGSLYTGVTLSGDTITLDVTAGLDTVNEDGTITTVAGINFLGDKGTVGAPTLVDFVQSFDVSAAYGALGGLATQANFHAQPGMDLTYSGNITLASSWNLGAGIVDQSAAIAAGVMGTEGSQTYVVSGQEAELLANYTQFLYRTGGTATGEAPEVSLRAGGNLHLEDSITDGFFQFGDQYDLQYLSAVLGGPQTTYELIAPLTFLHGSNYSDPWATASQIFNSCFDSTCSMNGMFYGFVGGSGLKYISTGTSAPATYVPYSAQANSAAALGSWTGGGGDPIGSAVIFPLLPGNRVVSSSSINLIAGSDNASANPLLMVAGTHGNFTLDGEQQQTTTVSVGGTTILPGVYLAVGPTGSQQYIAADDGTDWLNALETAFNGLDPNSTGIEVDGPSTGAFKTAVTQFHTAHPTMVYVGSNYFDFTLAGLELFLTDYFPGAAETAVVAAINPPSGGSSGSKTIVANPQTVVRTGTGSIQVAASGNVDLTNGPIQNDTVYSNGSAQGTAQAGGTSIYTAGHPVAAINVQAADPTTGQNVTVDLASALPTASNLANVTSYDYGTGRNGIPGVVVTDPAYLEGGGNITVDAGGDVLGRRDAWLSQSMKQANSFPWIGAVTEPWRTGSVGSDTSAAIDPQLFTDGIGTLGGGDVRINAGRNVSDLSVVATDSMLTASASGGSASAALATFGGGNLTIQAATDILGGRVDIASGMGLIAAGDDIAATGQIPSQPGLSNLLRLYMSDATVQIDAGGTAELQGVAALGPKQFETSNSSGSVLANNLNASTFYSGDAALDVLANGSVTITNQDDGLLTDRLTETATGGGQQAVYPGTFGAVSMTGDLDLATSTSAAQSILLVPNPQGQLSLLAGGNILSSSIAMLDADPGLLPGVFSDFNASFGAGTGSILSGTPLAFPSVLQSTNEVQREQQHNENATHAADSEPIRIAAGNDIGVRNAGLILSVPKQARVAAGRDIINMMFFGQNLSPDDITRIVAGRDIIATTVLETPLLGYTNTTFSGLQVNGAPLPALQGNTFVIGGPGNFVLEAGRDLGPFLNSATVTSYGSAPTAPAPVETYGGGILSVGNEWNPWLPAQGASLTVMFGVAKGADFDALRDAYLAPGSAGNALGDYGPALIAWMQQNAADVLTADYGAIDVTDQQAYDAFKSLPELRQRIFLLDNVYFNELAATADPSSPSYLQYSRGYEVVNTLFPASLGYTANNLGGGTNGANQTVDTGNLDLRLATIQTEWGGDIHILGPGGRVIAGSTVRTDQQAARRSYDGRRLFSAYTTDISSIRAAAINAIPPGYEGVLTLRGGDIDTFTDLDFLLNQSRLFTEQGGNIVMWSSNADLNAGQGPKTSANFPPVLVKVSPDGFVETDQVGATTGAGIAALRATPDSPPSDVYLIAPRGTVDAGAAGVRVSGSLSVAALHIANEANFQVSGQSFGLPTVVVPNIGALTAASSTAGQAAAAATEAATRSRGGPTPQDLPSIFTVEVIGYGGGDDSGNDDQNEQRRRR